MWKSLILPLLTAVAPIGAARAADEINVSKGGTLPGPGLAVHGAIALEARQCQSDMICQPLLRARKQESLFVDREQHVEMVHRQQAFDKAEKPDRVVAQPRTTMKFSYKARESRKAKG